MTGRKGNTVYTYIDKIFYDRFGNRTYVEYGNGTYTRYDYDDLQRLERLRSYAQAGGTATLMQDIAYTFDDVGNISAIENTASAIGTMGGAYRNNYTYDDLDRLISSTQNYGEGNTLAMEYSASGRLCAKGQTFSSQQLYYGYANDKKPHAPRRIFNAESQTFHDLQWDHNGNLAQVNRFVNGSEYDGSRFLAWSEDNRLTNAVDERYYSYYAYDHGGERTLKLSGDNNMLDINADMMLCQSTLKSVTLYTSPYLVAGNYGYTKHYYAGTERVAARIGGGGLDRNGDFLNGDPEMNAVAETLLENCNTGMQNQMSEHNENGSVVSPCGDAIAFEETDPVENVTDEIHTDLELEQIPDALSADITVDPYDFEYAMQGNAPFNDDPEDGYFYHSDHLGSASWITDNGGEPVQHLQYLPFGESFVNQRATVYNERFTFTGKEKDPETGYSYFGARYLEHELMTGWLSVDPMSDKYPSLSPYAYCAWNPVKLMDPDGKESMETDIINSKTGACKHIEDGKNQIVLLSDKAYNTIEKMGQVSYSSMTFSQRKEYNSLLNSGKIVSLNSKLGKTIRAVYAEMGNIECSEQDRYIVAASIATRLKSEPDIDKVLTPKQYNATRTDIYKIGPYERENQIKRKAPYFYKDNSKAILQSRLQAISASYRALNGLLPSEYNNIHTFVSPPRSSDHFDSNTNLTNVTSTFSKLKGVSGVWRLK